MAIVSEDSNAAGESVETHPIDEFKADKYERRQVRVPENFVEEVRSSVRDESSDFINIVLTEGESLTVPEIVNRAYRNVTGDSTEAIAEKWESTKAYSMADWNCELCDVIDCVREELENYDGVDVVGGREVNVKHTSGISAAYAEVFGERYGFGVEDPQDANAQIYAIEEYSFSEE